jgi:hypothetical protein
MSNYRKTMTQAIAEMYSESDLDEAATSQVLAHGGKGQYKVVSGPAKDGSRETVVKFKGKVVGKGDYDRGADGWYMNIKGKKGQEFFDDAQKMADYFAKNKITEGKEKDARQLIDPKKEVLVVKKNNVVVIDKINLDYYLKKGWSLAEETELDEGATADARRHAQQDKDFGRGKDSADVDTDASPEDIKGASKNIIMQMRKAVSMRGNFKVEFGDKKKIKIPAKIAQAVQDKFNSFKKPADKEKFQAQVGKSYKDMLRVLKAGYHEEVVKEGQWQIPRGVQLKGLKKLLTKPLELGKNGKNAMDALDNFIGDDELFDDLGDAGKKDPKGDARPYIKDAMKRLGIKEETILDRIDRKLKERKNG